MGAVSGLYIKLSAAQQAALSSAAAAAGETVSEYVRAALAARIGAEWPDDVRAWTRSTAGHSGRRVRERARPVDAD